jgi:hypothetical protein
LAILIPIYAVAGQDGWIWYRGHDYEFEYPSTWGLFDNPTGVLVGENETPSALYITMHKEGCYPLSQHPQLMDLILKIYKKQILEGSTPWGDPITQYSENILGPYSTCLQAYKNPDQLITCEIQGYTAKNATVTFTSINYNPSYADGGKIILDLARIKKSFNVTLSGNHTSYI